jgi:phage replication O-like protein O
MKSLSKIENAIPLRTDKEFTTLPNWVFDTMHLRTPVANVVYFAILRKTIGFQKNSDRISNSQFEKICNLSRPSVIRAKKELYENGWIMFDGEEKRIFAVNRSSSLEQLNIFTSKINESKVFTPASKEFLQEGSKVFTPASKEFLHTKENSLKETEKRKEEEIPSSPEKVFEKKKEESSFANQMLGLKDVVSSPVLNRNEAFQRMVNTISKIKKREKGEMTGYDSMNKNETANLYCLVDQFEGNQNVVLQILETMLEYQKSGKLKLYSEILRTTTKHTNPNFWNQATISAFYIVKFASDKEVIDTAIRENEIYQEHLKRKKEQATFAKSPEAKLNIPIDPEFAKQLKELKDKPVDKVDELEVKRKSDLEKMKSVLAATPKKCIFEIEREQEEKRKDILIKIELQKKVV